MKEESNLEIKVNLRSSLVTITRRYRLYNSVTAKCVVSRDVIIREVESWDWNQDGERTRVVQMQELNAV